MPSPSSNSSAPISPAEREVLAMLAEGHTAKSIATELDLSIHAVNERLREARRKTGATSSRELARRLAAQENWDKEIEVSGEAASDAEGETPSVVTMARRRRRSLIIVLATITVLALAVVSVQNVDTPVQGSSAPTVQSASVSREAVPLEAYRARFAAEARDNDWAPPAELRALAFFTLVDGVRSVDIDCAATLCRVDGAVLPDAMSRAETLVRGDKLQDRLGTAGLEVAAAGFRNAADEAETGSFTAFLRRAD